MSIDFYYAPGSAPCRIVELTAKALGIKLNYKLMDLLKKKDHLTPEFIKINPQHCIPTIVDNGFALCESNVIATYLVQKYARNDSLYPKDPKKRAIVDHKLYFNSGVFYSRYAAYYYPIVMQQQAPDKEKYEKMVEAVKLLDEFLSGQEFAAGDTLTVADFALSTTLVMLDVVKFDRSPYKSIDKWFKNIQATIVGYEEINGLARITKLIEEFKKMNK